jgi:hypothetical protein
VWRSLFGLTPHHFCFCPGKATSAQTKKAGFWGIIEGPSLDERLGRRREVGDPRRCRAKLRGLTLASLGYSRQLRFSSGPAMGRLMESDMVFMPRIDSNEEHRYRI